MWTRRRGSWDLDLRLTRCWTSFGPGLQVVDVDFLRRQLTVARQVQRGVGGTIEVRPPKYASERRVFLPDALVSMLAEHVAAYQAGNDPTRWLFGAGVGHPPHQNTIGHLWRQACRRSGMVGFTLHDLRHFYASGLIAAGCDVVTVQRALGHARATTTLNTYAHLWPTAEDRTRAASNDLMTAAMQPPADSLRTKRPSQASDLER